MPCRGRSRLWCVLALLVGSALVWGASSELAWPARLAATVLLAVLPVLLLVQAGFVDVVPPGLTRRNAYGSTVVGILVMAVASMAAALGSGFTPRLLGLTVPSWPVLTAAAVLTTAASFGAVAGVRALRVPEGRLAEFLIPRTPGERMLYVGVALAAGVGEELVFRGFLIPAVAAASGDIWLAAGLSAGAFGLIHSYQGAVGAVRAGVIGFILAVPFVATGSVLPSVVAHTVLDLVAGLWLGDWLMRR